MSDFSLTVCTDPLTGERTYAFSSTFTTKDIDRTLSIMKQAGTYTLNRVEKVGVDAEPGDILSAMSAMATFGLFDPDDVEMDIDMGGKVEANGTD